MLWSVLRRVGARVLRAGASGRHIDDEKPLVGDRPGSALSRTDLGDDLLAAELDDFVRSYREASNLADVQATLPYAPAIERYGLPLPPPRLPPRAPAPPRGTTLDCPTAAERQFGFIESRNALKANLAYMSAAGIALIKLTRAELAAVRQST